MANIIARLHLNREKRALVDIARIPYTKWCGSGNRADHQNDLGSYAGTDKCCRIHDTVCPMSINALSTGYGYYNHNLYTMSHCSCDERFRTCLQQTGTGASNMVGEIFFNIIKTKCFVIKKEKVCARRSWWGNCTRYRYKKTAISRDPMPY
ncbi:unnamed protein product [Cyprideis torosa]|uniref:Phospholipase A2 n=1 Tax=Cyprideis torosa TaxID=163714 RepID=A0A7R8WIA3_9CRUS|nr:unnamed protein product [Cyprideis torosa]CAG0894243.1 unnamed protein product [Cyprideis torosa]